MLPAFLLPLLVAAQAEPPTTVNGIEIGAAEDFATRGPARVCMREMVITPGEGEVAYLDYSGIHNGGIVIRTADDRIIRFTLGEIYVDRRRPDQGPVIRDAERRIFRFEDDRFVKYMVFVVRPGEEGEWRPLVSISGEGLGGNRADIRFFDRLSFDWDGSGHCDRTYNFGWGVILGNEPIDVSESE